MIKTDYLELVENNLSRNTRHCDNISMKIKKFFKLKVNKQLTYICMLNET